MFGLENAMSKSRREGIKKEILRHKKRMRIISTISTFVAICAFAIVIAYYSLGYFTESGSNSVNYPTEASSLDNQLKAALIDALYNSYPNVEFTESVNKSLRLAGFKVDIHQGEEVTVDFLKNLQNGYKLIIFRMHSALSNDNELFLFTAEPYSTEKYVQEQYFRIVKKAYATDDSQPVFAVNWGFIKKCMTEKFKDTLIVLMSCDSANDPQLLKEFVNQGAIGCVGWNGPVLLAHSDRAVSHFIEALYLRKLSLNEALNDTNNVVGMDPFSNSVLLAYVP